MPLTELRRKSKSVLHVYAELEKKNEQLLKNLEIGCVLGCGKCCEYKDISATPVEFLPYALSLFDNGTLEDTFWKIKEQKSEGCVLLCRNGESHGLCSQYELRGLICRLFGNAAVTDKYGKKQYIGCHLLKERFQSSTKFQDVIDKYAPISFDFQTKMELIDIEYGTMFLPINEAIMKALEIVYYNTRNGKCHG